MNSPLVSAAQDPYTQKLLLEDQDKEIACYQVQYNSFMLTVHFIFAKFSVNKAQSELTQLQYRKSNDFENGILFEPKSWMMQIV